MTLKTIGYAALSIAAIGLIGFGKYKLATARPTLVILALAGLAFAISTPATADASTVKQ